jgi:hypothetical protein
MEVNLLYSDGRRATVTIGCVVQFELLNGNRYKLVVTRIEKDWIGGRYLGSDGSGGCRPNQILGIEKAPVPAGKPAAKKPKPAYEASVDWNEKDEKAYAALEKRLKLL